MSIECQPEAAARSIHESCPTDSGIGSVASAVILPKCVSCLFMYAARPFMYDYQFVPPKSLVFIDPALVPPVPKIFAIISENHPDICL